MRGIIIEDEHLAADNLTRMLQSINPEIEILAVLTTVRESVEWLTKNPVDIIFMDIRLSDGLSLAIFEKISVKTPVIFTTAFDQYAIKVFEQNSVDYLLKPIKVEALKNAINKLRNLQDYYGFNNLKELLGKSPKTTQTYKERYMIRLGAKIIALEVDDIAFFYSSEGETDIYTKKEKIYPQEESLDKIEKQLDPGKFFRVNRQFLISYDAITEMFVMSNRSIKIKLINQRAQQDCLVSLSKLGRFKEWLDR